MLNLLNLLETSFPLTKKEVKRILWPLCQIIYSNMFYANKYFTFYPSLQLNFPTLSSVKASFRLYIKQRRSFEKSLSTFQPFTYDVSNERYLINEMCIEGFPQRLESRIDQFWHGVPKKLTKMPKIMIFTHPRDWSMIVRMKMLRRD